MLCPHRIKKRKKKKRAHSASESRRGSEKKDHECRTEITGCSNVSMKRIVLATLIVSDPRDLHQDQVVMQTPTHNLFTFTSEMVDMEIVLFTQHLSRICD